MTVSRCCDKERIGDLMDTSMERARVMSFGRWATRCSEFKSGAKSRAKRLADSTLALRRSIDTGILADAAAHDAEGRNL